MKPPLAGFEVYGAGRSPGEIPAPNHDTVHSKKRQPLRLLQVTKGKGFFQNNKRVKFESFN